MRLVTDEFVSLWRRKSCVWLWRKRKCLRFRDKRGIEDEWKKWVSCVICDIGLSTTRARIWMWQEGLKKGTEWWGRCEWKMGSWLINVLLWLVMSYGVEVRGWKEIGRIERMYERFLRWRGAGQREVSNKTKEESQRTWRSWRSMGSGTECVNLEWEKEWGNLNIGWIEGFSARTH